jgi:hypothetical protein
VIIADTFAQILGDVLDSFVLEAAGGAVRMAKHRKSDKIEVKDAAFFLGESASASALAPLTSHLIYIFHDTHIVSLCGVPDYGCTPCHCWMMLCRVVSARRLYPCSYSRREDIRDDRPRIRRSGDGPCPPASRGEEESPGGGSASGETGFARGGG